MISWPGSCIAFSKGRSRGLRLFSVLALGIASLLAPCSLAAMGGSEHGSSTSRILGKTSAPVAHKLLFVMVPKGVHPYFLPV